MSAAIRGCLLSAALILLPAASASAHELDVNTARVSVRDGNIVVHAELDVVAWVAAIGDQEVPLPLSVVEPDQLARWTAKARRQLTDQMRLEVDGERLELRVHEFPSDDEIVRTAARDLVAQQVDEHHHRSRADVVVEVVTPPTKTKAKAEDASATVVSLTMPESVGAVLVNFVQPQTALAEPGESSSFELLYRADDLALTERSLGAPEQASATATSGLADESATPGAQLGALGALVGGFVFGALACRRRRRSP